MIKNNKVKVIISSLVILLPMLIGFFGGKLLPEEIAVHWGFNGEADGYMNASMTFIVLPLILLAFHIGCMIFVCSANDSCVALAERIAGSQPLFVEMMNQKAQKLQLNDTLFANCTGLPKEPQYSCAKDVAVMLKSLLRHEKYYQFGGVWMDKFMHPKGRYTEITNTNRLVRSYDGCDGGKTGFTNEAGFCLAATAKRNNMRVISVVIGEESSDNRFQDVRTMFDYAFANYVAMPLAEKDIVLSEKLAVSGGKEKSVEIYPKRSVYAFAKRGEKANMSYSLTCTQAKAPIEQGECVGELIVYKDGVEIDRIEVLAATAVEKATIFDRFLEIARNWNA